MKKFIVLYHAPLDFMEQMGKSTPEDREKGMAQWMAWAERCGPKLLEMGSPLMNGQRLAPGGNANPSERQVCGYSILQAENMQEAQGLLAEHPHLGWMGGCEIEVHESMPMESH